MLFNYLKLFFTHLNNNILMAFIVSFVGLLGDLFAFGLQLSPSPAILQGIKDMEVKSLTLYYFITGIINAILWACYGFGADDIFIWGINLVGTILFVIYMNCFIYIQRSPTNLYLYSNGGLGALFLFCKFAIPYQFNMYAAAVIGIVWQSTTLTTMRLALKNKDSSFINILLCYISFLNFVDWTIYGILVRTFIIYFVNGTCGTIMFMNIYIYYWTINQISEDDCLILFLKKVLPSESIPKENEGILINNQSDFIQTPSGK